METNSIKDCKWFPFSDEPLLTGPWYATKISSPQVLLPSQSCDGRWHMFAHSWLGIHHYISTSGIAWEDKNLIKFRGKFPQVFYEDETYYLVYEKRSQKNSSCIEMMSSSNLITWSKPRVLLDGTSVPYSCDYIKYHLVSKPQLTKINGVYRLYFAASEVLLEDSKQKVARYLGCAFSRKLSDGFILEEPAKPILESDPNDPYSNLACGSVKIIPGDGFVFAFQCGVYWDEQKKRSVSALRILESEDGLKFTPVSGKPVLLPPSNDWASGYIMSCDLKYKTDEKCWYCYYSANNGAHGIKQKESVGLMIGSVPTKTRISFAQKLSEVLFV